MTRAFEAPIKAEGTNVYVASWGTFAITPDVAALWRKVDGRTKEGRVVNRQRRAAEAVFEALAQLTVELDLGSPRDMFL